MYWGFFGSKLKPKPRILTQMIELYGWSLLHLKEELIGFAGPRVEKLMAYVGFGFRGSIGFMCIRSGSQYPRSLDLERRA